MPEKIWFPTWRYKADSQPRLFVSQKELDDAGEGWVDSPDKIGMPVVIDDKENDNNEKTDNDSLSGKTVKELRVIAENLGIEDIVKMKKADLIDAISSAEEQDAEEGKSLKELIGDISSEKESGSDEELF